MPCLAAISAAFQSDSRSRQKPIALGIASLGISVGGVVFPIMLRKLVSHIGGAWAVRTLALVNLIAAFAIITASCRHPRGELHLTNDVAAG